MSVWAEWSSGMGCPLLHGTRLALKRRLHVCVLARYLQVGPLPQQRPRLLVLVHDPLEVLLPHVQAVLLQRVDLVQPQLHLKLLLCLPDVVLLLAPGVQLSEQLLLLERPEGKTRDTRRHSVDAAHD